jgi:hypothetical protein
LLNTHCFIIKRLHCCRVKSTLLCFYFILVATICQNSTSAKFPMAGNNENANKLKVNLIVPADAAAKRKSLTSKRSAKLPDKVDVHLCMYKDEATGQRTLTIGSKINSKWTDLSLRKENDWWNRLHYIPQRHQQSPRSEASTARRIRSEQDELNNIRCDLNTRLHRIYICYL